MAIRLSPVPSFRDNPGQPRKISDRQGRVYRDEAGLAERIQKYESVGTFSGISCQTAALATDLAHSTSVARIRTQLGTFRLQAEFNSRQHHRN